MDKLSEDLKKFQENQTQLETKSKEWTSSIGQSMKTLKELLKQLKTQENQLKQLHKDSSKITDKKEQTEFKQKLEDQQSKIKKLNNTLHPATGSLFVRLFLGRVNVKHYTDEDRYKLKAEYQKFKRRTDPMFILLVILRIVSSWRLLEILSEVWLFYYYATLALRENILKVNGSSIKPWWIFHHYIAMAISLVFLVWDHTSPHYVFFEYEFKWFALVQGGVQMMLTHYQSSKLYQQIAMGKARLMDVGNTDTVADCSLGLLFPFLLLLQLFQIYLGLNGLFYIYLNANFKIEWIFKEWEISAVSIIFLILGSGNLFETWRTYYEKYRGKKK